MLQEKKKYEVYWSAFWETVLVAIFTIMPTLFISASIMFDKETTKTLSDFYKSGEFFLYGVSFSSSAFLIYHSRKKNWGYFHLALILLASLAYAATLNAKTPNIDRISTYSTIIAISSLILFYFAQVYSNKLSMNIDVRDISNEQVKNIQNGLN